MAKFTKEEIERAKEVMKEIAREEAAAEAAAKAEAEKDKDVKFHNDKEAVKALCTSGFDNASYISNKLKLDIRYVDYIKRVVHKEMQDEKARNAVAFTHIV